ncbi:site-specific integrase [Limimaricola hongkongensis]|uniref:Tyr recombinase domain-containing protein n=1 Tax=Limimaricola hongkongensis DSM 17492 TaxID=1122180 RepID=A0A017HB89_9RHOB|nr:site-specific integrase [Limimaricola hongkongensis]EYD71423.1 hypothetical protein Lokhon_03072 [Limimaricola hongkongensis DSM 17492]
MTLAQTLRGYLEESGETKRALSLRAGLNPKAVADILNIAGLRPRHATLRALSDATGLDLFSCEASPRCSYADLIASTRERENGGLVSKLRWLCRNAGWSPELQSVCKQDVIDFFDRHTAASFNLSAGSYATYRSALIKAVGDMQPRTRGRRIDDIGGIYADVHQAITSGSFPESVRLASGSFLLFLHDEDVAPGEITTETFAAYFNHRVANSAKSEAKCEKHVREMAGLMKRLATEPDFDRFGFTLADHPFSDRRERFGVSDAAIATVMEEFDRRVAPWAQGQRSRDGLERAAFIAMLDDTDRTTTVSDKKARLRAKREAKSARPGQQAKPVANSQSERLRQAGFLIGKDRWSDRTLCTRRGYVVSLAKAVAATADVVPETIEELTDPEFLEAASEALEEANKGEFPSGYVAGVLKCARKIARDFQCRSPEDLREIDDLVALHRADHAGIAPRNKAKLRRFNDQRIQKTIDLSANILADVNLTIDRKRKAHRKAHGHLPKPIEVIDPELGRDIMSALAHDILLARAPRSENVLQARLDWIAWQDGRARIVIPAVQVKMRSNGDADLVVQLGDATSRLLRKYLDVVRPALLDPSAQQNPYLFPAQGKTLHGYYSSLLKRVTRLLHRKVGVQINPHLYRHLIGWVWLRESLDNLPKVQRLLGHKRLQTTIDHYAELDDSLVSAEWLKTLDRKSAA